MIHKKNILKRILYISLLTLLILTTQKLYAQYILTRNFEVNLSTAPFDVEITGETKDVYDIDVDKLSATVKNNNSYPISGNVTFNNKQVTTFEVPAGGTKALSNLTLTKAMVSGMTAGQYDLVVNVTAPYATTNNSIKVNLKGTITNVVKNGISEIGLGTTANPYLVYKVEDLVRFAQEVSNQGNCTTKVVKQIDDLDFGLSTSYYNSNDTSLGNLNENANDGNKILQETTTGTGFIGVGTFTGPNDYKPFRGTYEGNKKAIRNLYINTTTGSRVGKPVALFNSLEGATIKGLRMNGKIKSAGDSSSIAGWVYGVCNITDCQNWATVECTVNDFSNGGIVGTAWTGANLTLTDCWNAASVTGGSATAGMVGLVFKSTITMERCRNTANITSTTTASSDSNNGTAGLVVKNSSNTGTVNIIQCFNSGIIKGNQNVAGLISSTNGALNITSSYNTGSVTATATGTYAGGLLARHRAGTTNITNSYSAGTISSGTAANKGGLVGYTAAAASLKYSNSYYLSTTATSATSNVANTTISRTKTQMQASTFATTLGGAFKYVSGSYPQLTWQ